MKRTANQFKQEQDMKVTMTTVMCGPKGNAFQGTVLDIGKDETQDVDGKPVPLAQYLIDNKFARAYDPQKDAKARQHGLVKAER